MHGDIPRTPGDIPRVLPNLCRVSWHSLSKVSKYHGSDDKLQPAVRRASPRMIAQTVEATNGKVILEATLPLAIDTLNIAQPKCDEWRLDELQPMKVACSFQFFIIRLHYHTCLLNSSPTKLMSPLWTKLVFGMLKFRPPVCSHILYLCI